MWAYAPLPIKKEKEWILCNAGLFLINHYTQQSNSLYNHIWYMRFLINMEHQLYFKVVYFKYIVNVLKEGTGADLNEQFWKYLEQ